MTLKECSKLGVIYHSNMLIIRKHSLLQKMIKK